MSADLVARFEACTLPAEEFHHAMHVHVVWSYLRAMPMALAADRFIRNLKRYATSLGKATLFHETITWAYIVLTNERLQRAPELDWDAFCAANPDLVSWAPSVLDRYYSREVLFSDTARSVFLLPSPTYEELR